MKIKKLDDGSLRIRGSMDDESDYLLFREVLHSLNLQEKDTLHLIVLDASEIHPSICGLLLKLYNQKHLHIVFDVMDIKLAYYFRDVHLLKIFNVTLMNPKDYDVAKNL